MSTKQKRRRQSPLGQRQQAVQVITPAGRAEPFPGATRRTPGPLPELPNPLPQLLPEPLPKLRQYSLPVQNRIGSPRTSVRPRTATLARASLAKQRTSLRKLFEVPPPVSRRERTPCQQRSDRRSVMFAAGVAGKKWRAGGPRMRYARHTINSSFTCR